MVHAFNPSTWEPALGRQRQMDLWEFKASLVSRSSARTASKATQRNPVSKNQKRKIIIKSMELDIFEEDTAMKLSPVILGWKRHSIR